MLIAPDFFDYMSAASTVLWRDPSLFCATAYSENSQPEFVADASASPPPLSSVGLLLRSQSFTGGSWMIHSSAWSGIRATWTRGYWVDWVHGYLKKAQLACVRPEVARAVTFGESGINQKRWGVAAFVDCSYYWDRQKRIVLNRNPVDFSSLDLSYLLKVGVGGCGHGRVITTRFGCN